MIVQCIFAVEECAPCPHSTPHLPLYMGLSSKTCLEGGVCLQNGLMMRVKCIDVFREDAKNDQTR